MNHWTDIRTNWVNGSLSDAKEALYQQSKLGMLRAVSEALHTYYGNLRLGQGGSATGDLIDLIEIIDSFNHRR